MANFIVMSFLIGLAIATPIYSGLHYFDVIKKDDKKKSNVLGNLMIASGVYLFLFIMFHTNVIETFQSWFFDGKLVEREVFVPSDGEDADHYETKLDFVHAKEPHINLKGAANYLMYIILIGGLALTFYFNSQFDKRNKPGSEYVVDGVYRTFLIITKIVLATGLIICLLDMPYRYYDILRFVMLFGCIALAAGEHKKANFFGWAFFVCVAILFNPLSDIYLSRLLWNALDIAIAAILLAGAVKEYVDSKN